MNYRTLAQMAETIRKNLHKIPKLPVVGIPRSGMIAASMIATLKNVPLFSLDTLSIASEFLLVDDSVSGGETFQKTLRSLPDWTKPVRFAVYVKPASPKPGYWLEELAGPRVFEWNWHRHAYTKRAVFDIDGVLCDEEERVQFGRWDDLEALRAMRLRARPLHIPKRKILAIATGRKEVERAWTEEWLAAHGIRYEHLYMSTPERGARQTKLLALQATGASWMVESNGQQASWLAEHAKLPVLCTDLNRMFSPPESQG